jgi:hypothetical protein
MEWMVFVSVVVSVLSSALALMATLGASINSSVNWDWSWVCMHEAMELNAEMRKVWLDGNQRPGIVGKIE